MLEKRSFYINGSWVDPKEQKDIEVINPATEKVCAVISSLLPREITAQAFSVAGLITSISLDFFGATHEPFI